MREEDWKVPERCVTMRADEESKDAMGVIEMRRGMAALALAACLSPVSYTHLTLPTTSRV